MSDETIQPPTESGMDDIEKIISAYNQKAEISVPMQNHSPSPSESDGVRPIPFISHDPSQVPKQEFYKSGRKAGQPKPPRKGTAPPLNPAGQLSIQATVFITGAIFLSMVDLLIPLISTTIYNFIQSKKKDGIILDCEKMKMTPSQKADLAPVGDAVVRELKLSGSPTVLFLTGLAGVYFMNFIMHKTLTESKALKTKLENEKNNKHPIKNDGRQNYNSPSIS